MRKANSVVHPTNQTQGLEFALELFQLRNDFLDRFGASVRVFGKEILLLAGKNISRFLATLLFYGYNDADRVLVDAVLDHRRIRKDGPDGLQGRVVFLLSAVSVFRLPCILVLFCVDRCAGWKSERRAIFAIAMR